MVFFLVVNPFYYAGNRPSLQSFGHWVSLFFSQVCLTDPVIAVLDGENCNEQRRQLLPSYKAHRRKFFPRPTTSKKYVRSKLGDHGNSSWMLLENAMCLVHHGR